MSDIILTDNGVRLLSYLQDHDQTYVGKDLIDLTGIKGIYPVLNSLMRHGLVEQSEPVTRDFTTNKGDIVPKQYKTYVLTDLGRTFTLPTMIF